MEPLKSWAPPKDDGEIKDAAQIEKLRAFLVARSAAKPEVIPDETNRQTTVKMKGDILVKVVKMEHH